jgi:2,3-bisphosphoglycerate-independent phosphoglycerate mutase
MIPADTYQQLARPGTGKLILLVIDGLGGLAHPQTGLTELEAAHTPNLDALAAKATTGLSVPIGPGITPGSGPGHLALFGYDPIASNIGRGALSAIGIGLGLGPGDLGIRLNFCSLDADGNIADRRAGRIPSSLNRELVAELSGHEIGCPYDLATESAHRAVLVLRGNDFSDQVLETDPQAVGVPPSPPEPLIDDAADTAAVLTRFLEVVTERIGSREPANFVLMRGYATRPQLTPMQETWSIRGACAASYPMYKGLAAIAGMDVLDTGDTFPGQLRAVSAAWSEYDFFFVHYKPSDAAGEDGDWEGKARAIEEVDAALPQLLELGPAAVAVTGDHSTPAALRQHSWHPVPLLVAGQQTLPDRVESFGERACSGGGLGHLPARAVLPTLLATAGRLVKFGA